MEQRRGQEQEGMEVQHSDEDHCYEPGAELGGRLWVGSRLRLVLLDAT